MADTRRGGLTNVGRPIIGWVLLAFLFCAGQSGCVQRRMMVRTNPPGALLYVDDYEIGATPVAVNFTYYGTRKIRIVKDGFETLTVMQPIPAPWYQWPVFDFVSENMVPGQIRDQRCLDYQLKPQTVVPTEQLLARAEELRRGVHAAATPGDAAMTTGAVRGPVAMPPSGAEPIPTPEGIGGQPIHPLPPSGVR